MILVCKGSKKKRHIQINLTKNFLQTLLYKIEISLIILENYLVVSLKSTIFALENGTRTKDEIYNK